MSVGSTNDEASKTAAASESAGAGPPDEASAKQASAPPEELEEGTARIAAEEGELTLTGRIEEVGAREITVHIAESGGQVAAIARRVRFDFQAKQGLAPLSGAARPIEHRFDEAGDHYVLQVEERLASQVGEALRNARAFRVELGGRVPVKVRPAGSEDEAVEVLLKDISETGMSILVDRVGEARLAEAASQRGGGPWLLNVEFRLPGNSESLEVIAAVRYRALSRASVRYGLEFQGQDESQRVEQRARIADHLMRFQGEMLRRARDTGRRAG